MKFSYIRTKEQSPVSTIILICLLLLAMSMLPQAVESVAQVIESFL